jgi:hypothetical protein
MANTPNNVSDPNAGVKRAARSASPPWWVPVLTIAASATMIASLYGGPTTIATSLAFFMFAAVLFVARKQQRARRDVCPPQNVGPPQNVRKFAWASVVVVLIVMIAVLFSAATLLSRVLPPGTALSYGAQFLSAATVLGVGQAVLAYLGVRRRSEQHS